jgi:hypothetical protein
MGILSVRGTCSNFIETSLEREKGGEEIGSRSL